ncbi:TetR/AcrR family transcriptional regulator [Streptomyces sp. JNUCC 64]
MAEAALRVLSREGLDSTTTRAIVAEAGMSLASFHYAFSSREELLREVVTLVVAGERDITAAALAGHDGASGRAALASVLSRALSGYLATFGVQPGREHGMLELSLHAARTESLAAVAKWQHEQYRLLLSELLVAAADATGMRWTRDPHVLASIVLILSDGATVSRIVSDDPLADVVDACAEMVASFAEERV